MRPEVKKMLQISSPLAVNSRGSTTASPLPLTQSGLARMTRVAPVTGLDASVMIAAARISAVTATLRCTRP